MANVVTFDWVNLLIIEVNTGSPAVNELDAVEVYSEWKQALLDDPAKLGYPQAFTPVGGDPRTATQNLGITRFLENGWRIRPAEYSHKLSVTGNLFTREAGQSIFKPTLGAFNVHTETVVSNIIDTLTVGGVDQATVQTALTAQGYTTARAPAIDNLDATVSSRATSGQGLTTPQANSLALVDVAVSSRATSGQGFTIGQATSLATAEAAAVVAANASANLDVAVSTRAVAGQGLTSGQDTKLTQIDSRVDVATSTRAAPGQGLTSPQATALALIEERVGKLDAAMILGAGLVTAGSTSKFVHTDIINDANSQIGLTLVIVGTSIAPVARSIRTNDAAGVYEVVLPFVYMPEDDDVVYITSQWSTVKGTVR